MGTWGDGIYDSNSALDYLATITDTLDREIHYWVIPENVSDSEWWLHKVLTVVELILLFDAYVGSSSVFLREPHIVIHWRKTFLRVWDGDWKSDNQHTVLPYNDPYYRKLHRPGVLALFDHLIGIAQDWEERDRNDSHAKNAPLHPDYPLPYFSVTTIIKRNNEEVVHVEPFISHMIERRVQEIIYWLACERWVYVSEEDMPTAVDVLGFLCEIYDQPPRIPAELVGAWRTSALKRWQDSMGEDWGEADPMYQNIVKSFDRLEAMARKYPPMEW